MKKIRYIGGSWAEHDPVYGLTKNKIYDVISEDHHYFIISDSGAKCFQCKGSFVVVDKLFLLIHDIESIKPGCFYKNTNHGDVLYLGCINDVTKYKCLVVVMDDNERMIGKIVVLPHEVLHSNIWDHGFYQV